jgi:hypothetical protein
MKTVIEENPEHQYWPDQSQPIREINPYCLTLSRISRVVLSVSQMQFPSYLCKYNSTCT